jgi:putative ABC transport system permease protein
LRNGLVILQFAVSIGLGIGALVVFQQIQFARNIDLGFRRDNIVFTGTAGRLTEDGIKSFMQALGRGPGVLQVARTSFMPFFGNNSVLPVRRPGDAQFLSPNHISVSENYFQLFGIKVLAGRALQDNREEDSFFEGQNGDEGKNAGHNIVVNASMARALGLKPDEIVGKTFIAGKSQVRVVGVVADTLSEGTRSPVLQTVYIHRKDNLQNIVIRIAPGRLPEALEYIARTQRSFVHGVALSRTLLSDTYAKLYQGDERQGQIFAIFVGIAIFIASLGLFGLAAFTAGRRTREIGIRKVFGARIRDVVVLLLWQFSVPVLIANAIAWPVAWYYLHDWLQGFAYRITLNPVYFAAVGLGALVIAWLTILSHALRVARANPIHALRYE